jgi:hypothetical protein
MHQQEHISEFERIQKLVSKPCPRDFPKQLIPYWKGLAEFSFTPYQTAWMLYYEDHTSKNPDQKS